MSRFFVHKAWLLGFALPTGLAGMLLERQWLVWMAVLLLAAAVVLRLVERRVRAQ
ncbi:MAG TPA: hypothetical protein VLV45_01525 [Gemmatimonadales bacterium]|jgi:Zn-dependent membrane protease YugP|nr:hypothetical protein [Gemmatimonadales bacterium]